MHGYTTKRKRRYHNLVDIFSHNLFERIDTSPGMSPSYQLVRIRASKVIEENRILAESVSIDSRFVHSLLPFSSKIDGHYKTQP